MLREQSVKVGAAGLGDGHRDSGAQTLVIESPTLSMNTTSFVQVALPQVAAIAVFILACRAYLQHRSFGFLLLVFGFGIGALLATSSLLAFCGGPALFAELQAQVPGLWIATTFGPALCFVLGFLLLGKGSSAAAPRSKSSSSK